LRQWAVIVKPPAGRLAEKQRERSVLAYGFHFEFNVQRKDREPQITTLNFEPTSVVRPTLLYISKMLKNGFYVSP